MTTKSPVPKKISISTLIIYGVIAVILLVLWVTLGAAMDQAVKPDGKLDISLIGNSFEKIMGKPEQVMKAIQTKGSYAPKMGFLGLVAIGLFAAYKYAESGKRLHRRGVEHGSAKWGDKREMKSLADPTKPKFKAFLTTDGKRIFDKKGNFAGAYIDNNIILSEEVRMSLNTHKHGLNLNCLVIGGSGTGKTRSIVEPNIMQLNTSYVITDPKGEILQHTGKLLTEAGYELRVLNLIELEHSHNYNPFNYVYDKTGHVSDTAIQKMITALFSATKGEGDKDDFWSQKGKTVLNAIILLLFEESAYHAEIGKDGKVIESTRDRTHLNFYSVAEKMRRLQYPTRGSQQPDGFFLEREPNENEEAFRARQAECFLCPLDKDFIELEKRKPEGCLALDLYKEIRNAPEETGQSFLSTANVKTFMFNLKAIRDLTCCDTIELEKIGDRKTALFLIISSMDTTFNFLANIMYTQMFDTLSIQASFKHGGSLPIHVRCIMDEFANIGEIPEFEKVIGIVRSWNMSVTIILQSLAQLKSRYEKTHEIIIDCCSTTIFLGGKGKSTLKELSSTLGKETIDVQGYNRTKGKQSSTSENNS
ncbi:MAG: type IV secretory system conjugative DNA transfer family protein, partial [Oscillospiraceae bacterium]|nr:type IV secretory system conjugative DNA transfer family protein [Oscillospiraceae bacterium]